MKMTYDKYGIGAVISGLKDFGMTALVKAPMMERDMQDKAALRNAQMYAANMSGNKHGAEAESERFTLDQRRGIDDLLAKNPELAEYAKRMYQTFKITGDSNADRLAKAGTEFQTQGIRDQAVSNVNNIDQMNRFNTLAQPGKTYEPYTNIGNTGTALNKATGDGRVASSTLDKLFSKESQSATAENFAQAGAAKASAAKSYSGISVDSAQIEKYRADTEHTRQKTKSGAPTIVGYDQQGSPITETPDPKLTELQGKSTGFATRMRDASVTLDELEQNLKPWQAKIAGTDAGNIISTPEAQMYRQSQENWVTANLRLESGAAIPVPEMEQEIRKWFPRIGDSKQVIAQKSASRRVAEESVVSLSGPGRPLINRNLSNAGSRAAPGNAGPKPGSIDGGYRFKGGNPADPQSWEKLQ